jgi:hypothetical protein
MASKVVIYLGDAAALDTQHLVLERPELGVARRPQVAGGRWLALARVGGRRHSPEAVSPSSSSGRIRPARR